MSSCLLFFSFSTNCLWSSYSFCTFVFKSLNRFSKVFLTLFNFWFSGLTFRKWIIFFLFFVFYIFLCLVLKICILISNSYSFQRFLYYPTTIFLKNKISKKCCQIKRINQFFAFLEICRDYNFFIDFFFYFSDFFIRHLKFSSF